MSEVKERPILFSGEMVRALLAGTKTQTRRVVRFPPSTGAFICIDWGDGWWPYVSHDGESWQDNSGNERPMCCPYGKPGDRLWVRETWKRLGFDASCDLRMLCGYRDGTERWVPVNRREDVFLKPNWISSIHMPRWASRITLEVTEVRVQRLQDITEEDAQAEGAYFTNYGRNCFHGGLSDVGDCSAPDSTHPQREGWSMVSTVNHGDCLATARMAFANFWCKLAGDPPHDVGPAWRSNPWVWAVSFRVVQP